MLDLLGNEVKKNDVVAYVYTKKHGKSLSIEGKVKKFNKKGCVIDTGCGNLNVKNVIKLRSEVVKTVQKKQNGLLQFIRKIFK